jgi:hypothetical protein
MTLIATFGALWQKKDFESTVGIFNSQTVILNLPDALKNNPYTSNTESQFYAGAMVSGLYRY